MSDRSETMPPADDGQVDRRVRRPAQDWMGMVKPGDMLTIAPDWNDSEGQHKNRIPVPVRVLDVQHNVWGCQSGVVYTVRANGGALRELDAAWFLPPNVRANRPYPVRLSE
jgi:hypothetical protein